MSEVYFIADLHFGHKNILSYDNRPFNTTEEQDQTIIDRWNDKVGLFDEVWILGDISWYNVTKTIEILNQLNGEKRLCCGNHDDKFLKNKDFRNCFAEITNYKELKIFGIDTGVILSHYPIPCFKNHYYGWYHLYGHVHNSFEWNMMEKTKQEMTELYTVPCNMFNVGCMLPYMDFTPKTLKEIENTYEMWKEWDSLTRNKNKRKKEIQ